VATGRAKRSLLALARHWPVRGRQNNNDNNLRSAYRNNNTPDNRNNDIGFRVARAPSDLSRTMGTARARRRGVQFLSRGGGTATRTSPPAVRVSSSGERPLRLPLPSAS